MVNRLLSIVLVALLGAAANAHDRAASDIVSNALAAKPDPARGRMLYAKRCASCHGQKGWGDGFEDIPALAGQRELYLITQLAEFATQVRSGSAMHLATSTADVNHPQAIRNLAAFLSHAPANPDPEHAEDPVSAAGENLFQRNCAACHGRAAQGSRDHPIPALAGQHYDYTLIQLKTLARGHRGLEDARVAKLIAGLSDEEQKSIAEYLSRIKATGPGG